MADKAAFGMIGLGVMGKNLSLNISDHGYSMAVWNLEKDMMMKAVAGTALRPNDTLKDLVANLEKPRRIILLIKAGKPVDSVLDQLEPLLEPGDIVIDGGNSWYQDTQRREQRMAAKNINFFGMGVSGGEDGARHGPSMMPGGKREAYEHVRPMLEAIAAKTDSGPCVTYVGPDGAGHFVKMVHNGIEYADMQCIAEAYHVLREIAAMQPPALAEVFTDYNQGPLESFLIEITAKIFGVKDPESGGWLVDHVLDRAGQKGTGRWTAQIALELGVAIPSIAAAIDARVLSSMKEERVRASKVLRGAAGQTTVEEKKKLVKDVHDALLCSKICAYAQGMALIAEGSRHNEWGVDLREMARIWKGGCIIRARFLDTIMKAYERNPKLDNLLLDETIYEQIQSGQSAWRRIVGLAQSHGIPVPAMSASLAYYDSYRAARLPQNLTQAQRDAFGSHTYQRDSDPEGPFVHTDWL
ncbi:MAG: NADP-dependent phosphogluconate dehydrogenase [Myxococcales bacterium]|nr:NADP-dependent phosphogluconate dehydrogenase [Myxococcales bacterium]MCB9579468.1 NADP-dependent phosphogluconate dehydrogenase [Polyangiaceae bacterium]